MAYDILIKSGTIVDGSGEALFLGDIGISDGKIAAMGDLGSAGAEKIVNAYGKIVAPGFIDITNHSDTHLTLFQHPNLDSALMQGITTAIGGNCGASLAPLASPDAINVINKWANPSEINVNWNTVEEYLASVELLRPGTNYGTFVGYGTLRRGVMGSKVELMRPDDREQVKFLLNQGVAEGAFGLSLGLAYGHERVSTTEEIIEVARVLASSGGIIKIHLRSEGFEILSSVNEAVRIARETGVPMQISHFKAIGKKAWPYAEKALEIIARAKESGLSIDFDVSPYRTTGSLLYLLIPSWARQGGFTELFRRIDTPAERAKIIEALRTHTLHYDQIFVTSAKIQGIVGHSVAQIAEEMGMPPEEAMVEIIRANEGRVSIIGRTVSLRNTRLALLDKNSFIASDGASYEQEAVSQSGNLVHPRSFGTFPRFLGRFIGELKIPIADAIRRVTGGPARKLGISDRGILKKKNFADVVVFDPKLIVDRATYENPFRYPAGIHAVMVNGKLAVDEGKITGVRSGGMLRKP